MFKVPIGSDRIKRLMLLLGSIAVCGVLLAQEIPVDQEMEEERSFPSTFFAALLARAEAPPAQFDCPQNQWSSGTYSLERKGYNRRFRVHVPSAYDSALPNPLIVAFHGWGGDENAFLNNETVRTSSDQSGFIIVSPVGLGPEEPGFNYSSWAFSGSTTGLDGDGINPLVAADSDAICNDAATTNYTYPSCTGIAENGCSWTHCLDNDIEFAIDLVEEASQNLCIDQSKVFAVGGSNGGMFTWDLVRDTDGADVFAATASIIGLPHRGYLEPPAGDGGKPALLITGTNDRTVPPGAWGDERFTTTTDGDTYYYSSASAVTKTWAGAMGCDIERPPALFDVGVDGVECRAWSNCQSDSDWPPVLDCRRDMGHIYGLTWSWPLITDFFSKVSADP